MRLFVNYLYKNQYMADKDTLMMLSATAVGGPTSLEKMAIQRWPRTGLGLHRRSKAVTTECVSWTEKAVGDCSWPIPKRSSQVTKDGATATTWQQSSNQVNGSIHCFYAPIKVCWFVSSLTHLLYDTLPRGYHEEWKIYFVFLSKV